MRTSASLVRSIVWTFWQSSIPGRDVVLLSTIGKELWRKSIIETLIYHRCIIPPRWLALSSPSPRCGVVDVSLCSLDMFSEINASMILAALDNSNLRAAIVRLRLSCDSLAQRKADCKISTHHVHLNIIYVSSMAEMSQMGR